MGFQTLSLWAASFFIGMIGFLKIGADKDKQAMKRIFAAIFLAIFLLEMGMVTARRFSAFRKYGAFVTAFGIVVPLINGCIVAALSGLITDNPGNRFIFAILAASASSIAVPAAMRLAAPQADPGLYIPMALGVTFPFNITVGMPIYYGIVKFLRF